LGLFSFKNIPTKSISLFKRIFRFTKNQTKFPLGKGKKRKNRGSSCLQISLFQKGKNIFGLENVIRILEEKNAGKENCKNIS